MNFPKLVVVDTDKFILLPKHNLSLNIQATPIMINVLFICMIVEQFNRTLPINRRVETFMPSTKAHLKSTLKELIRMGFIDENFRPTAEAQCPMDTFEEKQAEIINSWKYKSGQMTS